MLPAPVQGHPTVMLCMLHVMCLRHGLQYNARTCAVQRCDVQRCDVHPNHYALLIAKQQHKPLRHIINQP